MENEEKSQAGTNLAIVILVLVIVVVGVKLLMSSSPAGVPGTEEVATSTATEAAASDMAATPAADASGMMPEKKVEVLAMPAVSAGSGQVAFSVSSPAAVTVREIFVRNPYRISDASQGWIQIYDGYKAVAAGSVTPVYSVSLAALGYDRVRVRTLSVDAGTPAETEKDMMISVMAGQKQEVTIAL